MDRTASFYAQPSYTRGAGLPIYSGSRRQRGGSVLGALKSFFMPLIGKVAKRGVSSAVNVAKNVALDAITGKNLTQSLKRRGINEAKSLGIDIAKDAFNAVTGRRQNASKGMKSRKRPSSNKARQKSKRPRRNF